MDRILRSAVICYIAILGAAVDVRASTITGMELDIGGSNDVIIQGPY